MYEITNYENAMDKWFKVNLCLKIPKNNISKKALNNVNLNKCTQKILIF